MVEKQQRIFDRHETVMRPLQVQGSATDSSPHWSHSCSDCGVELTLISKSRVDSFWTMPVSTSEKVFCDFSLNSWTVS